MGNCGTSALSGRRGRGPESLLISLNEILSLKSNHRPVYASLESDGTKLLEGIGYRPSISDRSNQDVVSDVGHHGRVALAPWSEARDPEAKKP